jgi:CRISPR-associated endonuclease/helicase Cas3
MLDVAAVASALLRVRPSTRARASRFVGLSESDSPRFLSLIAGLHDLGKFGRAFQNKAPEHWGEKKSGAPIPDFDQRRRHDADGLLIWREVVADHVTPLVWPNAEESLDVLMKASTAHHGRPVSSLQDGNVGLEFGPGSEAACLCAQEFAHLLIGEPIKSRPPRETDTLKASHWLAGFVTLADWVGSNTEWFPYHDPTSDLARYWETACSNAKRAVGIAGLSNATPASAKGFAELTGLVQEPSPLQEWAASVPLPDGPCLIFIEDVTGSGKTEAAQMLLHRLMTKGLASGAYWAMPTQATANAMWDRQRGAVVRLYADNAHPSLALAHGQAALSDPFQKTVLQQKQTSDVYGGGDDDADQTATASCTAFLAHDRRAALIADVGAGTIDQAILAALPARFNTMRLFGLAEKVLLLDEAHAYDAYVQAEMEGLLTFQAALGGSAIILSATLPMRIRRQYVRAWQSSMGVKTPQEPSNASYPLATVVRSADVHEYPLEAAARSKRTMPVRLIHEAGDAIDRLASAASAGSAVAWIRNTVDDALSAADQLRAQNIYVTVFHARFAQCDRQRREQLVMETFGKSGDTERRRGKVLIATQVIEQSLDLDFDLMVSDLAPIDLLIQRAGRLRRHPQRDSQRPPDVPFEFIVLAPPPVESPGEKWIKVAMPGTAAVYRNPTILWRTARALAREGAIVAPNAFRPLVEEVYDGIELPDAFSRATLRAEGDAAAFRSQGHQAVLRPENGYSREQMQWEDERRIETRINDGSLTIRLGRIAENGTIVPWAANEAPEWKAWALSELRVRAWRLPNGARAPEKLAAPVGAVRSTWKRFEQEIPLLVMEKDINDRWVACLVSSVDDQERHFAYDAGEGLSFEPAGG